MFKVLYFLEVLYLRASGALLSCIAFIACGACLLEMQRIKPRSLSLTKEKDS